MSQTELFRALGFDAEYEAKICRLAAEDKQPVVGFLNWAIGCYVSFNRDEMIAREWKAESELR